MLPIPHLSPVKHKGRAILLSIGVMFASLTCVIILALLGMAQAYTEKRIPTYSGEYQIDFVRRTDLEFIILYVEVTRSDGKRGGTMVGSYTHGCPDIFVATDESKLYFLCSDETITNRTLFFDLNTMKLYFGTADQDPESVVRFFD
jgi:hypothetical protein